MIFNLRSDNMALLPYLSVLLAIAAVHGLPASKKASYRADPCDPTVCLLPDCLCSLTNATVPNDLLPTDIPQIVFLTFDDAVSKLLYSEYYLDLTTRVNPNGAPIGLTFFITHEYNDYQVANDLWAHGHELASHSISHKSSTSYWANADYNTWLDEMGGMKEIIARYANVPLSDVQGARAPLLQLGGDNQYQAQTDAGLVWDSSWATRTYVNPPMWPYTLDYLSVQDCLSPPCPTVSLPGSWIFPMVDLSYNGVPCAMMDTCVLGDDATNETMHDFLKTNFLRHYNSNRAPFGMYTHAAWFQYNGTWGGLNLFLDEIAGMPDVYIVTIGDALKWIQNPTTLENIATFEPWLAKGRSPSCPTPINCDYKSTPLGSERYMMSCIPCPPNYPWLGNVNGD